MPLDKSSPAYHEFCDTALAILGNDVCKDWLAEIFAGADSDLNRAINHVLDTPDDKIKRRAAKPASVKVVKSGNSTPNFADYVNTDSESDDDDYLVETKKKPAGMVGIMQQQQPGFSSPQQPVFIMSPHSSASPAVPHPSNARHTALYQQQAQTQIQMQNIEKKIDNLSAFGKKLELLSQDLADKEKQANEVVSYDVNGQSRGRYSNAILQIGGKQDLIQAQIMQQQQMLQNMRNIIMLHTGELLKLENSSSNSNTNDNNAEEWWVIDEEEASKSNNPFALEMASKSKSEEIEEETAFSKNLLAHVHLTNTYVDLPSPMAMNLNQQSPNNNIMLQQQQQGNNMGQQQINNNISNMNENNNTMGNRNVMPNSNNMNIMPNNNNYNNNNNNLVSNNNHQMMQNSNNMNNNLNMNNSSSSSSKSNISLQQIGNPNMSNMNNSLQQLQQNNINDIKMNNTSSDNNMLSLQTYNNVNNGTTMGMNTAMGVPLPLGSSSDLLPSKSKVSPLNNYHQTHKLHQLRHLQAMAGMQHRQQMQNNMRMCF